MLCTLITTNTKKLPQLLNLKWIGRRFDFYCSVVPIDRSEDSPIVGESNADLMNSLQNLVQIGPLAGESSADLTNSLQKLLL